MAYRFGLFDFKVETYFHRFDPPSTLDAKRHVQRLLSRKDLPLRADPQRYGLAMIVEESDDPRAAASYDVGAVIVDVADLAGGVDPATVGYDSANRSTYRSAHADASPVARPLGNGTLH